MISFNQEQREVACEYHGGQFTPLYALCSSGKVPESNLCYLIQEAEECMALAKKADDWDDYFVLRSIVDRALSFDSFEFSS